MLGGPESGKSTILKQMRLIYQTDYLLEERLMYKSVVYANTIQVGTMVFLFIEQLDCSPNGVDLVG